MVGAGYNGHGKGADWVQKALWTAEIVRHPPKVAPQEVMKAWAREALAKATELEDR